MTKQEETWLDNYKRAIKIQVRKAERTAFCRCCDKVINRGDSMVSMWSSRNTGMWIYFDLDCAEYIGQIAKEHKESNATN